MSKELTQVRQLGKRVRWRATTYVMKKGRVYPYTSPTCCKEYAGRDRCEIPDWAYPCTAADGRHQRSLRRSICRLSHCVDACTVTVDRRSPRSRRNRLRFNVDRHAGLLTVGATTLRVLCELLLIHEVDNLAERPCAATANLRPQVCSDLSYGKVASSIYPYAGVPYLHG